MIVWGKKGEHNKDYESMSCTTIMTNYFYGCNANIKGSFSSNS